MHPFVAKCIQYAALVLMLILCFCSALAGTDYLLTGLGVISGIAGVAVWIIFGRCPKCGKQFGRYLPDHCPHCGEKIE